MAKKRRARTIKDRGKKASKRQCRKEGNMRKEIVERWLKKEPFHIFVLCLGIQGVLLVY